MVAHPPVVVDGALLIRSHHAARDGAWVRYLHVKEAARGLGVGTRLLQALESAAAQRGEPL